MRTAIVNSIRQGIRQSIRGSGEPVPSLFLGLQDSLQPTMSNTVNPGTFTRATEATYHDHEGLIRTAKSGQARMEGSRVVENLITASEDMTNGAYTAINSATVDSATQATFDGTTDGRVNQAITITDDGSGAGGRTFAFSVEVKLISGSTTAVDIALQGDALSGIRTTISPTSEYVRYSVSASTDAAGTQVIPRIFCNDAVTLGITKWQLEEVTGQTNQNPGEYVSTGVLSGTYHGLGVDGVKAFSTLNGNTVSSGVVTEATGLAVSKGQWIELDGVTGTGVSTGDNAANSVTDVVTIIAWVAAEDWAPSADMVILSKWDTGQRSYQLRLDAAGTIALVTSTNGTGTSTSTSSAATGFSALTGHYLRVTKSGTAVNFYTSEAPLGTALEAISWTALGVEQTHGTSAIYDGTADVEIGSNNSLTGNNFAGKISRALVIASTDPTATPVVDFNANDYEAGVTWETQSQVNTTELVANGTFDADSDWTGNGTSIVTISGGQMSVDRNGGAFADQAYQDIATTIGKTYLISGELISETHTSDVRVDDAIILADVRVGSWSVFHTATLATTRLELNGADNTGAVSVWDNISVIELPDIWTLNGTAKAFSPLARWGDFPGASGDYISTPDAAALDVTTEFCVIGYMALDDWTPASPEYLMSKWTNTGNQRTFGAGIQSDGTMILSVSADGSTGSQNATSATALPATDGVGVWLAYVFNAGNVDFYYSNQSALTPYANLVWVPLSINRTVSGGVISAFVGTGVLEVGSFNAGANGNNSGNIRRAALIASDSLTATPVADFDARTFTPGASTATAPTGETWTINGNVTIEQNISSTWDADGPLGYLAEAQRSNSLLQSNQFDTTWTTSVGSSVANYSRAPDGTKTAWRLIDNSATGTGATRVNQTVAVTSAQDTTLSVYAKADQLSWVALQTASYDASGNGLSFFDLSGGSLGTIDANHSNAGIEDTGDGWYRCWIVFQSTTITTGQVRIRVADADGSTVVDLDGTSSILIWGAQVEAGPFPTSYIPTTTTSATRNKDFLTYSATGVADSFPMTASVEATARQIGGEGQFLSADESGSSNDRFFITQLVSGLARGGFVDTTNQALIDTTGTLTPGVPFKLAFAMNANDFEIYKDGVSEATDTSGTATIAPDTIRIGMRFDDTLQANGTIRKVKIFNKRLTDSQVSNL